MSWYKEWFNDDEYLTVYSHRDEDEAEKLIDLIINICNLKKGSKILDLACGTGRHSIELAKRGFDLTGIDLSSRLLKIAKDKNMQSGLNVKFIKADMRDPVFSNEFDCVLNLFTSFGYFDEDEENEKVFYQISRSVKQNGWVIIDFFNSEYIRNNFIPEDTREIDGIRIFQKRNIINNRIFKKITITKNENTKNYQESVKLYSINDFKELFQKNNLIIHSLFGNYKGENFSENSERLIIFGKRI